MSKKSYTPINIAEDEETDDLINNPSFVHRVGPTHEEEADDIYNDMYSESGQHTVVNKILSWRKKNLNRSILPMLLLLFVVIALGTVNRVVYKIQLVPMDPYVLFISWFLTAAYVLIYFGLFFFRWFTGSINISMIRYATMSWSGSSKLMIMGLMDALGFVLGIFAARRLTGYLLTLLPQAIIPMTMAFAVVMLGARYSCGQLFGAIFIVYGLVVSLVPDLEHSSSNSSVTWSIVYFISIIPNAISFILREMVFKERPDLDIFVVNSFDSLWQFIFSIVMFPIVAIPGFGGVPFSELGSFFPDGAKCLVGITPHNSHYAHKHHHWSCEGEPELLIMYIVINVVWNISLLLLLKKGGAVLTFIAAAVSLPISHLAFAIDWPLLGSEKLQYVDIVALVIVLFGLIVYRWFTMRQKKHLERRRKRLEEAGLDDKHPLSCIVWPCAQVWQHTFIGREDESVIGGDPEEIRYY